MGDEGPCTTRARAHGHSKGAVLGTVLGGVVDGAFRMTSGVACQAFAGRTSRRRSAERTNDGSRPRAMIKPATINIFNRALLKAMALERNLGKPSARRRVWKTRPGRGAL